MRAKRLGKGKGVATGNEAGLHKRGWLWQGKAADQKGSIESEMGKEKGKYVGCV